MTGGHDAFSLLGIEPEDEPTDDEVRAAWRRIAAATHPDRADGGDPERFAAAAAAYTELRTKFGRNEARAALAEARPASSTSGTWRRLGSSRRLAVAQRLGIWRRTSIWRRVSGGRPARLALRVVVAAVAAVVGLLAAGSGPAGPALAVGAATWLVLTARRDLGPQ